MKRLMPLLHIAAMGLAGLGCANPLTADQIFALAQKQGFGADSKIMTQIALRESGGCADALNTNGEESVGLWQINRQAHPDAGTISSLSDPNANAQAAYALYKSQGLSPWYVGTNAAYDAMLAKFDDIATQAEINAGIDPSGGAQSDASGLGGDALSTIALGLGLFLLVRAIA